MLGTDQERVWEEALTDWHAWPPRWLPSPHANGKPTEASGQPGRQSRWLWHSRVRQVMCGHCSVGCQAAGVKEGNTGMNECAQCTKVAWREGAGSDRFYRGLELPSADWTQGIQGCRCQALQSGGEAGQHKREEGWGIESSPTWRSGEWWRRQALHGKVGDPEPHLSLTPWVTLGMFRSSLGFSFFINMVGVTVTWFRLTHPSCEKADSWAR